jgi:hypothetical protein
VSADLAPGHYFLGIGVFNTLPDENGIVPNAVTTITPPEVGGVTERAI